MSQSLTKLLQKRKSLAAKRDEIDAELRKIDHQIFPRVETLAAAIDGNSATTPVATESAEQAMARLAMTPPKPRPKILILEIEKILIEAKRPMKTSEIYEALKGRGIEVNGKVPQNNVSAHLAHHKNMFISTTSGWSLRSANLLDAENNNAHAQH